MGERIQIKASAAEHVQAYLDYHNIVGNADNGKIMSEAEFENFKKKVKKSRQNRLYAHWRNSKGMDCKTIGASSTCFCGHRYKEHTFDNVETKDIHCNAKKCRCQLFSYIPVFGSNDIKCFCKHSFKLHHPLTRICQNPQCTCKKFASVHSCNCGLSILDHKTVFQTREERQADGREVDPSWMQNECMYAGMGGIGNFQALADGHDVQMGQNKSLPYQNPHAIQASPSLGMTPAQAALEYREIEEDKEEFGVEIDDYRKELTPLDLFNMPHKYGKAYAAPKKKLSYSQPKTGLIPEKVSVGKKGKGLSRASEGIAKAKELAAKKDRLRALNEKRKQEKQLEQMQQDFSNLKY